MSGWEKTFTNVKQTNKKPTKAACNREITSEYCFIIFKSASYWMQNAEKKLKCRNATKKTPQSKEENMQRAEYKLCLTQVRLCKLMFLFVAWYLQQNVMKYYSTSVKVIVSLLVLIDGCFLLFLFVSLIFCWSGILISMGTFFSELYLWGRRNLPSLQSRLGLW